MVPLQLVIVLSVFVFFAGVIGGILFCGRYAHEPLTPKQESTQDRNTAARIKELKTEAAENPRNPDSWARLGNLYFDTEQYEKSIEAYQKSLSLEPNNPDVWTDLGIMYRSANRPDKAVEAFDRAMAINPKHENSRFNKGVVLLHDLNQPESAIQEWEELSRINPSYELPDGEHIDEAILYYKMKQEYKPSPAGDQPDEKQKPLADPSTGRDQSALEGTNPQSSNTLSLIDRPIEKSLWVTLATLPKGRDLVYKITRIFESRIDFRKLRKGDRITIALDEQIGDKGLPGDVVVRAVKLNHRGKDLYAFHFPDENGGSFFDENGKSLRGAFLLSPVSTGRITSRFSTARLHPVSGKYAPHYGIDYAAPAGTPIVSIADGLVQETATHRAKGKFVRIKHSGGYETEYLHMSRFEKGVARGTSVRQGQIIGYVGATGIATGPHVELRLMKNGRFVDLSKESIRYASFLPSPLLDCFQERVEIFKEYMATGNWENASNVLFTCASEKESEPL